MRARRFWQTLPSALFFIRSEEKLGMPTRNISLTPEQDEFIEKVVKAGEYQNAKAAELMGVGRPALSNLLNGNAALSADMAARLEKAFKKFTRKELLDMQAEDDAAQANKKTPADTKAYVPPFLGIRAIQIE